MREVIWFNPVSLGGCFEGPGHLPDWHRVDEEFRAFAIAQLRQAGVLLFGRRTYETMASFWSGRAARSADPLVAGLMNGLDK